MYRWHKKDKVSLWSHFALSSISNMCVRLTKGYTSLVGTDSLMVVVHTLSGSQTPKNCMEDDLSTVFLCKESGSLLNPLHVVSYLRVNVYIHLPDMVDL